MTTERFSFANMRFARAFMHVSPRNAQPKPRFMHTEVMP
jgi:hypothetical protein